MSVRNGRQRPQPRRGLGSAQQQDSYANPEAAALDGKPTPAKPLKGGLVIVGGITLGGTIEPIHNPIDVVELAMEKGAAAVLVPVSSRRALIDLSDDVATKVQFLLCRCA